MKSILWTKIKICFDGRVFIGGEIRGISRYTYQLIWSLQKNYADQIDLYFVTNEQISSDFCESIGLKRIKVKPSREILWEQYYLPKSLKENKIDLYHATNNRGLPFKKSCRYVLTIHDIVENLKEFKVNRSFKSSFRQFYSDFVSIRSADHFITVSEYSKKDIMKFWKIDPNKISVTYEAADERFYSVVDDRQKHAVEIKYNLPDNYFLYLGGFDKKKNVAILITAYSKLPDDFIPLVIAGDAKWEFSKLYDLVNQLKLNTSIFFTGRIDDEDLPALYQSASFFVFPSIYEGFGLPVVEAMVSGLPIICSEITALPEITNGDALYFNPYDSEDIAAKLKLIYSNLQLQKELRLKSLERAQFFSWDKMAQETFSIYKNILS